MVLREITLLQRAEVPFLFYAPVGFRVLLIPQTTTHVQPPRGKFHRTDIFTSPGDCICASAFFSWLSICLQTYYPPFSPDEKAGGCSYNRLLFGSIALLFPQTRRMSASGIIGFLQTYCIPFFLKTRRLSAGTYRRISRNIDRGFRLQNDERGLVKHFLSIAFKLFDFFLPWCGMVFLQGGGYRLFTFA